MNKTKILALLTALAVFLTIPGTVALGEAAVGLEDKKDGSPVYRTEAAVEGKPFRLLSITRRTRAAGSGSLPCTSWRAGISPTWSFRNTCPC